MKKIPMRKCMGCNEEKSKRELLRIVRTPENEVKVDLTGKLDGRGAYICKDIQCFERVKKSGRLSKQLGLEISESVYEALAKEISEGV